MYPGRKRFRAWARSYWNPKPSFARPTRRHNYSRLGRKSISMNQKIRNVINNTKEAKYKNTTINTNGPVAGTGEVVYLTGIQEGTSELQRDGQEVFIHGVKITLRITQDITPTVDTVYRVLLIRAKHNVEGVLPTVTEILETDSVWDHNQIDSRGDYQILFDKLRILHVDVTSNQKVNVFKYNRRFRRPLKMSFDGAGTGIADAEKGHFFLVLIVDQVLNSQPQFNGEIRFEFKE